MSVMENFGSAGGICNRIMMVHGDLHVNALCSQQ